MKQILLVCSAGMSTSLLVTKMEGAAKDAGYEAKIFALPFSDAPRVLEDVDIAVINGNYALEAGLDVNNDAFYAEDKNVESLKERRNVLAVKEGNENSQKIKDLTEALTSDEVREFIEEKYKGAVVPVF